MELKEIKAVIDLMTRNGLSEFELERQDFKIRIKKGQGGDIVYSQAPNFTAPALPPGPVSGQAALPAPVAASTPPVPPSNTRDILSPMVGTFYRSPSPDSAPYIEVGKEVTEDTVVCIIEAMKVMNEIKAEVNGTIVEVLHEGGKPVDFNKPLFRVKVS